MTVPYNKPHVLSHPFQCTHLIIPSLLYGTQFVQADADKVPT